MTTESIDIAAIVERATHQIEKVYRRLITDAGIEHTRLAKIGFMGVMHELVTDDPHPDPGVQAGILKYIEDTLDGATDGLKSVIQEHMVAVGEELHPA